MKRISFKQKKFKSTETPFKLFEIYKEYKAKGDHSTFIKRLSLGDFDEILTLEENLFPNPKVNELCKIFKASPNDDYDNAIKLYESIDIEYLEEVSDPRLWSYLCLVVYKQYIIDRYDLLKKNPGVIEKRLFYLNSSANKNATNAISRLWWAVHLTKVDDHPSDIYYYTKIIFSNTDILFNIIERKHISKNRSLVNSFLDFFITNKPKNKGDVSTILAKHIYNHIKSYDLNLWDKSDVDLLILELYKLSQEDN